jgi:hypothetical protein
VPCCAASPWFAAGFIVRKPFLRYAGRMVERVLATEAALALIAQLGAKHGPLMFQQSRRT